MSQDITMRLRELAEALQQEESRIRAVDRALMESETRRVDALRQAREWLERARDALESAPPQEQQGGVMRGEVTETISGSMTGPPGGLGAGYERSGPMENSSLAGDDDTPGYGRGGRGGF